MRLLPVGKTDASLVKVQDAPICLELPNSVARQI